MYKLLTVHEVAEQLNVAPKTVRKWIKAGSLSAVKMGTKDWRLKQSHVDAWIDRRTVKAWAI